MRIFKMRRFGALLLCLIMLFTLVSCSKKGADGSGKPADYGTYGADIARKIAKDYPYRKAFTASENEAGAFIKKEFEKLGYKVETQSFGGTYGGDSYNYIVHIEGSGFVEVADNGDTKEIRRKVVIGAHYDSAFSADQVPEDRTYDGISDNASGVGCLLTLAKELKQCGDLAFDIDLVAFGAGCSEYAGARKYVESLSSDDLEEIEVMYCISNIYAGDKVYASSGLNSLDRSQKYKMRRKLYQAYDVAYNDMLASVNGFYLYYNESNIVTDINGDGEDDIYREVSVNKSDYTPFDEKNVPIVFFDSGDYFFDSLEKTKETKNLTLQEFDGKISGTFLDSSAILDEVQVTEDKDLLEIRINNIAYCIIGSLQKGSDFGLTHEQYEESLRSITTEPSETSKGKKKTEDKASETSETQK